MISILMLTYNAPIYVFRSIVGVKKTKDVKYELIVLDNRSGFITRAVIWILTKLKYIDKLYYNSYNSLFAKGNNLASGLADENSDYYLLLNSDIKIRDPLWLKKLVEIHPKNGGISAFGAVVSDPVRADGYCMLIDKPLYDKYKLDESFEWWWGVTKLESQVLAEDLQIVAVKDHENVLHHYGGASGKGYANAKGMSIKIDEVMSWFDVGLSNVIILDNI